MSARAARAVFLVLSLGVVAAGCISLGARTTAPQTTGLANTTLDDGARLYKANCATCHGDSGDRVPVAPLSSANFLDSRGDATLVAVITDGKGVMPAWGKARGGPLNDSEVRAVVGYLSSASNRASPLILAEAGRAIYTDQCVTCHGTAGDRVPVAPLNAKAFLDSRSDAQLADVIARGTGVMPGFGTRTGNVTGLSDEQVRAVAAYLRTNVETEVADRVGRGRTLYVNNCLVCHGEKGDRIPDVKLASTEFLSNRGDAALAQTILDGKGAMPRLMRARNSSFDVEDIGALLAYLKTWAGLPAGIALSGTPTPRAAATAPTSTAASASASAPAPSANVGAAAAQAPAQLALVDAALGKDLFGSKCSACHGQNGDQVPTARLNDAAFLQQRGDQGLQQSIDSGKGGMPAMGKDKGGPLTGDDIASLIAYLKSRAGISAASAPGTTPPSVAAPVAPVTTASTPPPLTDAEQALVSRGRVLFTQNCTSCHGQSTEQLGKLANATWLVQRGDRAIAQTIVEGRSVPGAPLAMPGFGKSNGGQLSDDDVGALVAYLKTNAGLSLSAPPVQAGPDPARGGDVFVKTCSACHGAKGDQLPTARLNERNFLELRGDRGLIQSITNGKGGMPAFGSTLNADDIASVVAFLDAQAGIASTPSAVGSAGGIPPAGPTPTPDPVASDPMQPMVDLTPAVGQQLFQTNCAVCHGEDGKRVAAVPLLSSYGGSVSARSLNSRIANGAASAGMPAFSKERGGPLSSPQIAAIVVYIKDTAAVTRE